MKTVSEFVLLELASRWEKEAEIIDNKPCEATQFAAMGDAKIQGHRECKRECADALRMIVSLLAKPNGE